VLPVVHATTIGDLPQPRFELRVGKIKSRVRITGGRLGADHWAACVRRELHAVGDVGLTGVALLGHLDVDPQWAMLLELLQLAQLVDDVRAESVRYLTVAALDHDLHVDPPSSSRPCSRLCGRSRVGPGRTVRVRTDWRSGEPRYPSARFAG
jgi:hypothetical protein